VGWFRTPSIREKEEGLRHAGSPGRERRKVRVTGGTSESGEIGLHYMRGRLKGKGDGPQKTPDRLLRRLKEEKDGKGGGRV